MLAKKIDGALTFLRMICYDLIRSGYKDFQPQFSTQQTEIFTSSKVVKVEVSLLVLALVFPLLKGSVDNVMEMKGFLLEMIEHFNEEVEPLIQLRVINLVGYCLDMNYLSLVVTRMQEEPHVLRYQGFSTLNRILRTANLEPAVNRFLSEVFTNQLPCIETNSYLFETIVLNNYDKLLTEHPSLKESCIIKLVGTMKQMVSTKEEDKIQSVSFNIFHSIILLETDNNIVQLMEDKFSNEVLEVYNRASSTEESILQIMIAFLTKLQKAS